MNKLFEWSAGSIVGTDHRKPFVWGNSQDSFAVRANDACLVAVVADGCGSSPNSEVGAKIGARLASRLLLSRFSLPLEKRTDISGALEEVRKDLIRSMADLLHIIDGDIIKQTVIDFFLFTINALVITPESAFIAGIGDGIYAINGVVEKLGPFPGNEPPYLAYGGLVKSSLEPELCKFAVHREIPAEQLQNACIGTDGAADFERISESTLPGKQEPVGYLSQFWTNDQFFRNPQAIRRRLNLINNSVSRGDWDARKIDIEHGRLPDDTTLVVVRRRPQPEA